MQTEESEPEGIRLMPETRFTELPALFLLTQGFVFLGLVILDVAHCYLWLFTLYINIKIGTNSC